MQRYLPSLFNNSKLLAALLILFIAVTSSALAENWPGWRGPEGDGTSSETKVPTEWSPEENIAWKVRLSGSGHASPIVWEDRVFLVVCLEDTEERMLLCLDRASGKTWWSQMVVRAPLEKKHALNSFASSTPATDGKLVYVSFLEPDDDAPVDREAAKLGHQRSTPGWMVVAAYDMEGTQQWISRPGSFNSTHGFCSSPVLYKDLVILNGDQDGVAYLVALDRKTGETVWKTPRENNVRSYCVPLIREIDGRTQLILSGSESVASFDPADGSRHWVIDGPTEQFVASMVYGDRLLLMTAGFPDKHILAIRPDGEGNVTDSHIAWRHQKAASYVPSPIAVPPYFLLTSDNGIASCFHEETGDRLWMQRLGRHYSGSPVAADGLVYFTDDDGTTKIVRPASTFELVAENEIGERCFSSPAISDGEIFIRGEKHLFCIGSRDTK